MLVTVDTEYIDLVHNTEVLESALNTLPPGWIVELEFFMARTASFTKTHDGRFIPSDISFSGGTVADFITIVQGNNPLDKEAMRVSFHEPLSKDPIQRQNDALHKVMSIKNGETLLGDRFIKCNDLFLDTLDDLNPVGMLTVANSLFSEEYGQ